MYATLKNNGENKMQNRILHYLLSRIKNLIGKLAEFEISKQIYLIDMVPHFF